MRTGKKEGKRGKRDKGKERNSLFPESDSNLGSAKGSFLTEFCYFPDDFKQKVTAAFHLCWCDHL